MSEGPRLAHRSGRARRSDHVKEVLGARDLWINLTLRELRGKYKRSTLGWTWSLLNPLATMVVFTVVFRYFLEIPVPEGDPSGLKVFALFLLCGLLPWNYVANSMTGGMSALIGNANLVKKVYFPREILVGANVASWVVAFLIELLVLAIAFLVVGNMVLPYLPAVILVVALQSVFVLGIALLLAVLNVYFRDVQHMVGILLQVWFYATPIVYPIDLVANADKRTGLPLLFLYELNPMVRFVEVYRSLLYDLRLPELAADIAFLVGASGAMLLVGYATFRRFEPRLAEEL